MCVCVYGRVCVCLLVPGCTSRALLTLDRTVDFIPPRPDCPSLPAPHATLPPPLLSLLCVCECVFWQT